MLLSRILFEQRKREIPSNPNRVFQELEPFNSSRAPIRPATCRNHPISTEPIPVYRVANDPRTRNPPSPENRSEFPERTFRCFAD